MDNKIANNLVVGLFFIAAAVGLVFILFNINGKNGLFSNDYTLYAKFKHVKGLNHGSEVSLMGVRAGTVDKVEIGPEGDLRVKLRVNREMQSRIRADSLATIRTSGVLGDKYIEVSLGSSDKPELKDSEYIGSQDAKDLVSTTGDVVGDIGRYFQKNGDIDQLLRHLNRIAENVAGLTSDLQRDKGLWFELSKGSSGTNLNKSLAHLEGILRKVETGEGSLGALINDPTVYEDLKSLLGGAKRSNVLKYFMRQFIESGEKGETPASNKKPDKK